MLSSDPDVRTFKIAIDSAGSTIPIKIGEPNLRAHNLSLTTWTSSVILANKLHKFKPSFEGASVDSLNDGHGHLNLPVLELGAGTALVGISAAVIWSTPVVLTDLSPIVPGIAMNINLNQDILSSRRGSAAAGALDWCEPSSLVLHNSSAPSSTQKARVILAADVIYDSEQPGLLSNAILHWMERGSDARLFLALPLRVAYLDEIRELWERLEQGGLEAVEEGKEEIQQMEETGWEWDDEALCEWSVWRWRVE